MADFKRPLPEPTPETQHFWDGCRAGELKLQKCDDCEKSYFPPRAFCPACGSRDVSVYTASGMSLGYADETAPVNTLVAEREPLSNFAFFCQSYGIHR